MIYNVRHDKSRKDLILQRIRERQQFSQGWGGGSGGDLDLRDPDFTQRVVSHYDLKTTRVPSSLTRMREFQDGDILVTPHLPEYGHVSIHVVNGAFPDCYDYDTGDSFHLNHRISLQRSVGLDGEISIYNERLLEWRTALPALRLSVLRIPHFAGIFSTIVDEVKTTPSRRFPASSLDNLIAGFGRTLKAEQMTAWLRRLTPSDFEGLCEKLLKFYGYTTVRRNWFDRQGGDVDLICRRSRSSTSPFENGNVALFVQIKKHEGETDERAVQQVINMLEEETQTDGCVMSMADDYTESAKKIAEDNGIVLLNKDAICSLFLKLLSELDDD